MSMPSARHRSRFGRWRSLVLLLPSLALLAAGPLPMGCDFNTFPILLDDFNQSGSVFGRWFAPGYDNGVQDCEDDEFESDLYVSWPLLEQFEIRASLVTRCRRPDGLDRLQVGPVLNLTENLSIDGCENPFPNLSDYSGAANWIVTDVFCNDGLSRVVAGEIQPNGSVDYEVVLTQGQEMDDGLEYVDPRFVIPYFSMGYDGVQPFFAMGIKIRNLGTQEEPRIAVGLCWRTDQGWVCVSEYEVGQGELASYGDLHSVRADVGCPTGSLLGDDDCLEPAPRVLALAFRDSFQQFPFLPATAVAEGDFLGGPLNFIARQGDEIPGFAPRTYQDFGGTLGNLAFGRGGGSFSARDDLGFNLVANWTYTDSDEQVIAVEGDAIEGTDAQVGEIENVSWSEDRTVFGNFDTAASLRLAAAASRLGTGPIRIRGLYRPGLDVVDNAVVDDSTTFIRGLERGMLVNGVRTPGFQYKVSLLPLDTIESVSVDASSVYGSEAVAGTLNVITRDTREVEESFDLGETGFRALTLFGGDRLLAGSSDPTDASLWEIDRDTHLPARIGDTGIPDGIQGLAARLGDLYATNGYQLFMVDPETAARVMIGDFADDSETPVVDMSGLAWDASRDELFGVSRSGSLWAIDTLTARVDWRLAIPDVGGEPRSLAIGGPFDFNVGKENGTAYQLGASLRFGGGSGGGAGSPDVQLQAIADIGDAPLEGLALEPVPEPEAWVLAAASLAAIAVLRRRAGA